MQGRLSDAVRLRKQVCDVVTDGQAGLVGTLSHQVADHTTRARHDVITVALVRTAPMSSSSHGFTQPENPFQEQPDAPGCRQVSETDVQTDGDPSHALLDRIFLIGVDRPGHDREITSRHPPRVRGRRRVDSTPVEDVGSWAGWPRAQVVDGVGVRVVGVCGAGHEPCCGGGLAPSAAGPQAQREGNGGSEPR